MKDIIISAKQQKKELFIFLGCFIAAEIVNAISIIVYNTNWIELLTHIGYVFCIAVGFYCILLLIRLLSKGILYLFRKRKKN